MMEYTAVQVRAAAKGFGGETREMLGVTCENCKWSRGDVCGVPYEPSLDERGECAWFELFDVTGAEMAAATETVARYAREGLTRGPLYAAAAALRVEVKRLQAQVIELEREVESMPPEGEITVPRRCSCGEWLGNETVCGKCKKATAGGE